MPESRQYELIYVIAPTVGEKEVADLQNQIQEIVKSSGGKIEKTETWGRRRLAYEIDRHKDGTYVLELLNGPVELVKELDRRLRVIDDVLRHLIVRVDEDLRKAAKASNKRKLQQQQRQRHIVKSSMPDGAVVPAAPNVPNDTGEEHRESKVSLRKEVKE
jgi:small subunit ribosomal protein S6